MQEHNVPFVRIEVDGVAKVIRVVEKQDLKIEAAKDEQPEAQEATA